MKKILSITLVVVLLAGIAVSGTMAYLQDTASDVNVMTLGNVKIEQIELQRAEGVAHNAAAVDGSLEPFEQGQALLPAVPKNNASTDYTAEKTDLFKWGPYVTAESDDAAGTAAANGLWNEDKLSGAMDKFVFVKNTGKSDAYYRTLIAFECPEDITIGEPAQGAEIMINRNGNTRFDWEDLGYITVDGVRYAVLEATYNKVLEPGKISRPSLLQVVMTHNATNEDMELLGDEYTILVLSQAVQTNGFADAKTALDTAFGVANEANVQAWFGDEEFTVPTAVATADELVAALANGESVYLTADIENIDANTAITVATGKNVDLNLNGHKITGTFANPGSLITNNGELTIEGEGEIAVTFNGTVNNGVAMNAISNRGKLTINGGKISNTGTGNQIGYAIDNYNGATLTINGGEITASGSIYYDAIRLFCGSNETVVTVNDGKISSIWAQNPSANKATEVKGTVIVNGGEVTNVYYENYTTVKVAKGVTTTVTPYGAGSDNTTSASANGYTVYSFVH